MRWFILPLLFSALCAFGCSRNAPTGPTPGYQASGEGGWNARQKSVPGVPSYYGKTQTNDDDN